MSSCVIHSVSLEKQAHPSGLSHHLLASNLFFVHTHTHMYTHTHTAAQNMLDPSDHTLNQRGPWVGLEGVHGQNLRTSPA